MEISLPVRRRRRLPVAERHAEIIDAALRVAERVGAQGLIRDNMAQEAGVSNPLLHRYFGSMDLLRELVIQKAFERKNVKVLFKSLSIEDFKKLNTDPDLAKQLCEYIMM